jgi:hypothetical protein
MTCREFKQNTEVLTLWELVRMQDQQLLQHAQQCDSCGAWTREQRALAASLHTLQARTETVEASPKVEQAILEAFRQKKAEGSSVPPSLSAAQFLARSEERRAKSDLPTPVAAPFALRLSRWFEIGAYVAVAAAIVVGLLLGIRLVQRNSKPAPVQSQTSPAINNPALTKQVEAAQSESHNPPPVTTKRVATVPNRERIAHAGAKASLTQHPSAAQVAQVDEDGYVPLMFCDPLSCAADSQVVRMELPPNPASQSSQPQMADVVVGYDGVVRAVRIVN